MLGVYIITFFTPAWYIVWLGTVQKVNQASSFKASFANGAFPHPAVNVEPVPMMTAPLVRSQTTREGLHLSISRQFCSYWIISSNIWHILQEPSANWSQWAGAYRRVAETCNKFLLAAAKCEHLDFALSNGLHSSRCTDLPLLATFTYTSYSFLLHWHKAHLQQAFFHSCSPVTFSMREPRIRNLQCFTCPGLCIRKQDKTFREQ